LSYFDSFWGQSLTKLVKTKEFYGVLNGFEFGVTHTGFAKRMVSGIYCTFTNFEAIRFHFYKTLENKFFLKYDFDFIQPSISSLAFPVS
jgi:hypothetical protein